MLLGVFKMIARSALQATLGDWVDDISLPELFQREAQSIDEIHVPEIVSDVAAIVPEVPQAGNDALNDLLKQQCPFRRWILPR